MKPRIGDLLIQYGLIAETQLDEALGIQETQKKRLGEILMELGYLTSKDLIWILSEQADIPFVELNLEMLDPDLVSRFPEKLLYENAILPLYETDQAIYVAQGDPTAVEKTAVLKTCTNKNIIVSGADPATIEHLLDRFYLAQRFGAAVQKIDKFNTLRIITNAAHIELINDKGQIFRTTGSADVSIQYASEEESRKKDTHNG
ncbi:hypothetical protein JXB22_05835 [candidate division WOR-3 bacterium]|nr:hypothetical protein [candidate division WOR-3 bacterium]